MVFPEGWAAGGLTVPLSRRISTHPQALPLPQSAAICQKVQQKLSRIPPGPWPGVALLLLLSLHAPSRSPTPTKARLLAAPSQGPRAGTHGSQPPAASQKCAFSMGQRDACGPSRIGSQLAGARSPWPWDKGTGSLSQGSDTSSASPKWQGRGAPASRRAPSQRSPLTCSLEVDF